MRGAAIIAGVPELSRLSILFAGAAALLAGCADTKHRIVVSVPDQRMAVFRHDQHIATFAVSTSRFCLGDDPGTNGTPLGRLEVARKFGGGAPIGMKFKSRKATGEIVPVNAPGRDPIVTRILWLRGLEPQNRNAYGRYIYIHGTPEEHKIGTPASYGCVRMRSRDIVWLYDTVGKGARVEVTLEPLVTATGPMPAPADAANPDARLSATVSKRDAQSAL
jgi:lipoprotein-anchoring transpeptidase ErfK/SrfK